MKTRVELQQHTPIIQFQHEQAGATLRASELKPKIDRFVLDELKNIDMALYQKHEALIKKSFSKEKAPSQYKVHVRAEELAGRPISPPAPYFGEFCAVRHNRIQVEIFSFHSELVEFIKKVVPCVLAYNNFGSRQSKGFGCFLPQNMDRIKLEDMLCKKYKTYWVNDGQNNPFGLINTTYQLLKGGVNIPGRPYKKSELFQYMCGKDIRWEKHRIKTELNNSYPDIFKILKYDTNARHNRIKDCPAPDKTIQYRYIRAMLGLAEHSEYMVRRGNSENIRKVEIQIKDKQKDKQREIKRFRSPITFKVMNNRIYLLPEPDGIGNEILGREFDFILKIKKERGTNPPPTNLFTLKTPDPFNLIDFLKTALPNIQYNWQLKGCNS